MFSFNRSKFSSVCFVDTVTVILFVYSVHSYSTEPDQVTDRIVERKFTEVFGLTNKNYTNITSQDNLFLFIFTVDKSFIEKRTTTQLRVEVSVAENASLSKPILFTAMHQRFMTEIWLPFTSSDYRILSADNPNVIYYGARTLCINSTESRGQDMTITVQVLTHSIDPIEFSVFLGLTEDHELSLDKEVFLSFGPTSPIILRFSFNNSDYVQITALTNLSAESANCITMSIQPDQCPIYDLPDNVHYQGFWQTISKSGAMSMKRRRNYKDGFVLVFVAHTDEEACNETDILALFAGNPASNKRLSNSTHLGHPHPKDPRAKTVAVLITNKDDVSWSIFLLCLVIPLLVTLTLFIAALIPFMWRHKKIGQQLAEHGARLPTPGSDDDNATEVVKPWWKSDLSIDVFKCRENRAKEISKKYWWTTLIVAIFFGAPAYQLVLYYLRVLNKTGDLDMCYYNYRCAQSFGSIIDFNHLFSNVTYIILGILFIFTCKLFKRPSAGEGYGIPSHFGVFYALGGALGMVGVLSSAYHLCPNQSTFQFDTCFMYVIAVLILLKVYQFRHPSNFGPNTSFAVLALLQSISVIGLIFNGGIIAKLFVGLFLCLQFTTLIFVIFPYLYSIGHVVKDGPCSTRADEATHLSQTTLQSDSSLGNSLDVVNSTSNAQTTTQPCSSNATCLHSTASGEGRRCRLAIGWDVYRYLGQLRQQDVHADRLIFPAISLVITSTVTIYSLIFHIGYASHILYVLVGNALASAIYYVVMKALHGEFREYSWVIPLAYFLASLILGGLALSYFFKTSARWELPASHSRELNEDCLPNWFPFHPFYDTHDAWHFLSAASLFLAFMGLLTIDDDLATTPQTEIMIF